MRNNNWGSPIIVKANKTPWPTQMWNAGQASKNVNIAAAKHQKHVPVKHHTHRVQIKTVEEAMGVDTKKEWGTMGTIECHWIQNFQAHTIWFVPWWFWVMVPSSAHTVCCHNGNPGLFCCMVQSCLFIIAERQLSPPLPPCRNANLPEDFGQESSGPANKLHTTDRVDPSTSQYKSSLYGRYN